ncbi:MAG: CdaR family protein [Bacillota bacterium]|nr:CdaR family protein [Bacillota bacterium]
MKDSNKPSLVNRLLGLPGALFRASFAHNFALKMLSLALAILFWVFVMDQVNPETTRILYNVPVRLINYKEIAQNNLQLMNEHDYFANVQVTGRRNQVISLTPDSVTLTADMRNMRNGINHVPIQASLSSDLGTVKLLTPNEITLTFDRIVSIPKTVQVEFSDNFTAGLSAADLVVAPTEIRVSGPESIVNTVAYLRGYLAASAIDADVTRDVLLEPIDFEDKPVTGVKLEQAYASAKVTLNRTKTVPVRAVFEEEIEEGYVVLSKKIRVEEVTVVGPKSIVDGIHSIDTEKVTIRGRETYSGLTTLVLPKGVFADESSVRYDIEIESLGTLEFAIPLTADQLVGLPTGLRARYREETPTCIVRVKGISSQLESVTSSMLRIAVDLSAAQAGEYMAPIIVEAIKVGDEALTVELEQPTIAVQIETASTSE